MHRSPALQMPLVVRLQFFKETANVLVTWKILIYAVLLQQTKTGSLGQFGHRIAAIKEKVKRRNFEDIIKART